MNVPVATVVPFFCFASAMGKRIDKKIKNYILLFNEI